ncbi:MAG: hypothetical protein AAF916_11150 [Planctomycetota bacterium]
MADLTRWRDRPRSELHGEYNPARRAHLRQGFENADRSVVRLDTPRWAPAEDSSAASRKRVSRAIQGLEKAGLVKRVNEGFGPHLQITSTGEELASTLAAQEER